MTPLPDIITAPPSWVAHRPVELQQILALYGEDEETDPRNSQFNDELIALYGRYCESMRGIRPRSVAGTIGRSTFRMQLEFLAAEWEAFLESKLSSTMTLASFREFGRCFRKSELIEGLAFYAMATGRFS